MPGGPDSETSLSETPRTGKNVKLARTGDDEISTGPCLDLLGDFLTNQIARRIDEKIRDASAGDENDEEKEIDDAKQQTAAATRRCEGRGPFRGPEPSGARSKLGR